MFGYFHHPAATSSRQLFPLSLSSSQLLLLCCYSSLSNSLSLLGSRDQVQIYWMFHPHPHQSVTTFAAKQCTLIGSLLLNTISSQKLLCISGIFKCLLSFHIITRVLICKYFLRIDYLKAQSDSRDVIVTLYILSILKALKLSVLMLPEAIFCQNHQSI